MGLALPGGFETARLRLRPIVAGDAEAILDGYAQDAVVTRYLTWRPHVRLADTEGYVAACMAVAPDVARTYGLVEGESGALLGALDVRFTARHRVEFGYVLGRTWWGRGLMTEALVAVVDWALAQPSIFRIGSVCDVQNVASARVMEKAGLVLEGVRRRWLVHPNMGDEPRDCLSYALVR